MNTTSAGEPAVSVVIPTRERPELLERCLSALERQDMAPEAFEVIVVDDGRDGSAATVVAEHAGVRLLRTAGAEGPAAARNLGWRAARAPVVAFTDDDCVPAEGWLTAGMRALGPSVDGVSGRLLIPSNGGRPSDYERNAALLAASVFVTANCFYRRAALEGVGGFDERFRRAWREDTDLYLSLLERGATLALAPEAVVTHPLRPAPWGISLRQQRKVRDNPLLYKKHRDTYREHVQPSPRWYYLPVLLLVVTAFSASSGRTRPAGGAALAWSVATLLFSVRRLAGTSSRPSHVAEMVVTSALIPPLSLFWRWVGSVRHRVLFP